MQNSEELFAIENSRGADQRLGRRLGVGQRRRGGDGHLLGLFGPLGLLSDVRELPPPLLLSLPQILECQITQLPRNLRLLIQSCKGESMSATSHMHSQLMSTIHTQKGRHT
jgi:hypothetical protein